SSRRARPVGGGPSGPPSAGAISDRLDSTGEPVLLPFIVIGLTTGAVYALAGLGLVLTYKTSGVFNFAMGALATVAAYVFYVLYVLNNWSWVTAALVAIFVTGPLMGVLLELLARRIQTTSL